MAQLPPKIPSMAPNWSGFCHQKMPSVGCYNGNPATATASTTAMASQNPCWVDEFLDFSSARRGSHRRCVSDSITFIEATMHEECRVTAAAAQPHAPAGGGESSSHRLHLDEAHNIIMNNDHEFHRFDDEQFMSMFTTDEISAAEAAPAAAPMASSSNPSTPSDHNSIDDDEKETKAPKLKNESEEVDSQCEFKSTENDGTTKITSNDGKVDPKRVKRILANRQSAQRSRVRKLQYTSELERSVTSLQAEVSVLSPRVAFLDHQRLLLNVDNSALKQRIAALAQDKVFKEAQQGALKREIERLRQVYQQQNLKKMESIVHLSSDDRNPPLNHENEQFLDVPS